MIRGSKVHRAWVILTAAGLLAVAGCGTSVTREAQQDFNPGRAAFEAGRWQEAADGFTRFLAAHPSSPAHRRHGRPHAQTLQGRLTRLALPAGLRSRRRVATDGFRIRQHLRAREGFNFTNRKFLGEHPARGETRKENGRGT